MTKQCFGTSHVPLSPAVRCSNFVIVSGQVPVDGSGNVVPGGVSAETRQVMKNIESCLEMAGCTLADVVKTTVWLRDRDDFSEFNVAYAESFPSDPPARSTAESRLMIDIAVEIEAVAYRPA
jgi:2-iminobutanoate/2-iminopropanoate deaminase